MLPALHSWKDGLGICIREAPGKGDSATGTALVAGMHLKAVVDDCGVISLYNGAFGC